MKLFRFFQILIFLIIVFVPLYLYFSYSRFYKFIHDANLKSPYSKLSFILENQQETESTKYVALGDSLSAGVGSTDFKQTFVYQYSLNLSTKYSKVETLNLGLPGGTTLDVINSQLTKTIEENPNYVTLLIGTNDMHNKMSTEEFQKNYGLILQELLSKTNAQITVINIPYLGSNKIVLPPYNWILNMRIKTFNKIISDQVEVWNVGHRINFVDLYEKTGGSSPKSEDYYSTDLFHPSNTGYLLWAQYINAN